MTKSLFAVALSAGIIAFGGAAFAQSSGSSESGTIPGKTMHRSMKGVTPTKALVGKDVVNAKGEKIGEVDSIDGNMVIVGVGGFLGIGEHDVALSADQITRTGTGKNAKLKVNLTKDRLKAMPEYKKNKDKKASPYSGMQHPGPDNSMGSGGESGGK